MSQEKKRKTRVLLYSYEHADRWGDSYEDRIYLRKMEDGSLKMVAVKFFQGRRRVLDSVLDIQNAESFNAAFSRINDSVNHDGYQEELIDQVAKLDKKFAKVLREKFLVDEDEAGEEPIESEPEE